MDTISITGCWEGALLSDQGGLALPFSLKQPPREARPAIEPTLRVGDAAAVRTTVLDGASRSIVALAESTHDPISGRVAQLLVDARVHGDACRGDRLVGRWLRRDADGCIIASGALSAGRTCAE